MQLQFIQSFEDVLWVLVLIGVLINIHEMGHYWVARYFDVKEEVFSFGLGPCLFRFHPGESAFRLFLIPSGAYVKMTADEDPAGVAPADPLSLLAKPRWQRLLIA